MDSNTTLIIVSLAVTLLLFIITLIVFKDKISAIEFSPHKIRIRAEFAQGVKEVEKHAQRARLTAASGRQPTVNEPKIDFRKLAARDYVIEAWGALKHSVFNACAVNRIELARAAGVFEAVKLLSDAGLINAQIALLIKVLYGLGSKIADVRTIKPPEREAESYIRSVYYVLDWLKANILTKTRTVTKVDLSLPRQTVVGEYFPQPRTLRPAAWLVGIEGHVQGQLYPVNKEYCRIGSKPDNDICIKGDQYVSGHHALLRYEQDVLFLFDQNSRNGTFLNSLRVTQSPHIVRLGDNIRVGESVLQFADSRDSDSENGDETPKISNRDKTRVS